jgi:hypothetical protein
LIVYESCRSPVRKEIRGAGNSHIWFVQQV